LLVLTPKLWERGAGRGGQEGFRGKGTMSGLGEPDPAIVLRVFCHRLVRFTDSSDSTDSTDFMHRLE
jgi:hypothetical protein